MSTQKILRIVAGLAALLVIPPAVHAEDKDAHGFSIAIKGGFPGYGGEIGYRVNDYFGARAAATGMSLTAKDETNPGNKFKLEFVNAPIILDWHVFGGSFRVSAGYVIQSNEMSMTGTNITVGGGTATTATANVTFGKSGTYVGLGWGGAPSTKRGFGFGIDLGAIIVSSPKVTMTASGVTQPDIDQQIATYEEDFKNLRTLPVIMAHLGYTF